MTDDSNQQSTERPETMYHSEGSRVVHDSDDCHHLDNANDVEELSREEAESYRRCYQCAHDAVPEAEKRHRERRRKRRRRTTTVRVRR